MSNQPPEDRAVLAVRDLTKAFRRGTAVDRVSFTVNRGEIVGFLGPNGAGKTTVMNIVMGLLAPDHGTVSLFGVEGGFRRKDVLARIGYLQEKPRIYPDMTARAYLAFFGELYGVAPVNRRVGEVLERVGLAEAADKRLATFSRGMQQRACLARVMLHRPELLILDEPALGLDPSGLADMRAIFLEMRAAGSTLLFSSHQLAEMERIADSLVFMHNGKIAAAGPQSELLPRRASNRTLTVELFELTAAHIAAIRALPWIAQVREAGPAKIDLLLNADVTDVRQARAELARALTDLGLTVLSITAATPTLEDLFIRLTAPAVAADASRPEPAADAEGGVSKSTSAVPAG
jgi:ABC-2 type transport system ATP-binding protein